MPRLCSCFAVIGVLVLIAGVAPLPAQQAKIEAIDSFGPPTGTSGGNSVTDSGVVAGGSNRGGGHAHPMRWTSAGGTQDLIDPASVLTGNGQSISADGASIVGFFSDSNGRRAYRWTQAGGIEDGLAPHVGFTKLEAAYGVSADGSVVVGMGYWSLSPQFTPRHAFRRTAQGIQDLGTLNDPIRQSEAYAVSADGSVVVGKSQLVIPQGQGLFTAWRAFRWTQAGGMQNLGYLDDGLNPDPVRYGSEANAVSADGSTVVGRSQITQNGLGKAFVHTLGDGMQALPILNEDGNDQSNAYGVSGDGRIIVGTAPTLERPNGEGCIWIDGNVRTLRDFLENEWGLDTSAWTTISYGTAVSPDGTRIVGSGLKANNGTAFCVTLRPDFQPPTLVTDVEENETFTVKVGETFSASFLGTDLDGEGLTLTATGLPDGATLTPTSGTTSTSPIDAELSWTPTGNDFGSSHEVTIAFDDGYANGKVSRTFTIEVPDNDAPTVLPLGPQTIECEEGQHLVTLSTTVDDADGDPLNVTWTVDGEVAKTDSGIAAGSEVSFEHDYPHGVHAVSLEVSDGYETTTVGTTVTVQDTTDPIVVVAADVVVPTDSGKDFASGVVLPEPEVSDSSGHEVTLTSDAPEVYLLGETIVTWTAEDEFGNETTATQKVIVEDREAPKLTGIASVLALLDPGKIYSTTYLPPPEATDNVDRPWEIQIVNDAPLRLPVGTTRVMFTATDRAGNAATWPMDVRVVNHRPFANAGGNILVTTKSERGARVRLDGRWSSDRDAHRLKFFWSAPGVKFAGEKSDRPSGFFPVGVTQVLLTVTDPLGKTDVDRVRVVVRLKDARHRPLGAQANEAFAAASHRAASSSNVAASSGLLYASAATALGDATGEFVRWEEGQSEADALLAYAELRMLQKTYGEAAGRELLSAYAQTGDENLLTAYVQAAVGSLAAEADLREP